ncbi:MAG: hypothetical protein ACRD5R_06660 [Candidatus Acidiferrales bacterium]
MLITIRGVALGTVMFLAVVAVIGYLRVRHITQAAHLAPGQTVGIDIRVIAAWTIQNPMFWITFIVMVAIGSGIVSYWKR